MEWIGDCVTDTTCVEGIAATVAAVIIFCGSVFFLLMMVMGGRLAYFVTASVTLAFIFIMSLIWSFTFASSPLGPVGELPSWKAVDLAAEEDAGGVDAPSAEAYPDEPWRAVDQESEDDLTKSGLLGSDALNSIEAAIEEGDLPDSAVNNTADSDTIRFLEQDGALFGGVVVAPSESVEVPEGEEPPPSVVVFAEYEPGNPLWEGRKVAIITFVLLVVHLALLNLSEKRVRRRREAVPT